MADMYVDRACVRARVVVAAPARAPAPRAWWFFPLPSPRGVTRSRWWSHVGLSFIPHVGGKGRVVEPSRSMSARLEAAFSPFFSVRLGEWNVFQRGPGALPVAAPLAGGSPTPPAGVPPPPPSRSSLVREAGSPVPPRAFRPSPSRSSLVRDVVRLDGFAAPPRCLRPRWRGGGDARAARAVVRAVRRVRVPAPPPASDQRAPPRRRPRRAARRWLVGASPTSRLAWVDETCLAVIGVAAGSELRLAELRKNPRPTLAMVASLVVVTWVFVFTAFLAVGRRLCSSPPARPRARRRRRRPRRPPPPRDRRASAIAILREMDARGPFCARVLEVTVVKDVVVVLLFALAAARRHRLLGGLLPDPRPSALDDDLRRHARTARAIPGRRDAGARAGPRASRRASWVPSSPAERSAASATRLDAARRPAPRRGGEARARPSPRAREPPRPPRTASSSAPSRSWRVPLRAFLAASFARLRASAPVRRRGRRRRQPAPRARRRRAARPGRVPPTRLAPGTNLAFFTLAGAALALRERERRANRRRRRVRRLRATVRAVPRRAARVRPRRRRRRGSRGKERRRSRAVIPRGAPRGRGGAAPRRAQVGGVDGVRHAGGRRARAEPRRRREVPGDGRRVRRRERGGDRRQPNHRPADVWRAIVLAGRTGAAGGAGGGRGAEGRRAEGGARDELCDSLLL